MDDASRMRRLGGQTVNSFFVLFALESVQPLAHVSEPPRSVMAGDGSGSGQAPVEEGWGVVGSLASWAGSAVRYAADSVNR